MDARSTASKPSLPNSAEGFTLVEVLVAAVLAAMLLTVAVSIATSSRRVYELDQSRVAINQNLRNSLDMIGNDVRQAGERLPPNFPAITLIDGGTGAPDTLIIRRSIRPIVLQVCRNAVSAGDTVITVAATETGCDVDAGLPVSRPFWQQYRTDAGGSLSAYLYTTAGGGRGEFVTYIGEADQSYTQSGQSETDYQITLASAVANNYNVGSSLYLIEERAYTLVGDELRLTVNQSTPQSLTFGTEDFQVRIQVANDDGSVVQTLDSFDQTSMAWDWSNIVWLEPTLSAVGEGRQADLDRAVSARFFPRNILSN